MMRSSLSHSVPPPSAPAAPLQSALATTPCAWPPVLPQARPVHGDSAGQASRAYTARVVIPIRPAASRLSPSTSRQASIKPAGSATTRSAELTSEPRRLGGGIRSCDVHVRCPATSESRVGG